MIDEKYYLPDKTVEGYLRINERLGEHSLWRFRVTDKDGLARPILTVSGTNLNFVQDDNMTDKIEYLGNCYPERRGGEAEAQEGMVYGTDGVSPSIVATSYKGTMPKIITDNMQDKQVTTCALRGRGESGNLKEVAEQGGDIANSITTSQKASMVMEVGNIYPATGNPQAGRIYDEQGISPALDTMEGGNRQPKIFADNMEKKHKYRIRRLTEREVFRLMDLEEKDIDTIQAAGISGTQQYKLAGNSVVAACWYHIMRKLFVEKDCEERQLTLF